MKFISTKIVTSILLLLVLFQVKEAQANHLIGVELSYKHDSANTYTFYANLFRDCRGVAVSYPPTGFSILRPGLDTIDLSMVLNSIENEYPYCSSSSSGCSPTNTYATGDGLEKHVVSKTINFNKAPYNVFLGKDSVRFQFGQCCRFFPTNPPTSIYVYSLLDLSAGSKNSSPQFITRSNNFICCNQAYYGFVGAVDHNPIDSIAYHIVRPLQDFGVPISISGYNYQLPFTFYNPTGANPPVIAPRNQPPLGFYFNQKTGEFIYTPTQCFHVSSITFEIEDWRKDSMGNYQLIGTSMSDHTYVTANCNNNKTPHIKAASSLQQEVTVNACDDVVCFAIESYDENYVVSPNPFPTKDTIVFDDTHFPQGATFEVVDPQSNNPTGKLCLDLEYYLPRTEPYLFPFTLLDNQCPRRSVGTSVVQITINQGDSTGRLQVEVIDDQNLNCTQDNGENTLEYERRIQTKSPLVYLQSKFSNEALYCSPLGQQNLKLIPHPWFIDSCSTASINISYDSTHVVDFFSKIRPGISGVLVESESTNCNSITAVKPLKSIPIEVTPGPYYSITDINGFFHVPVPNGSYKVKAIYDTNRFGELCVDTTSIIVSSNKTVISDTIYLKPKNLPNVSVNLTAINGDNILVDSTVLLKLKLINHDDVGTGYVWFYVELDTGTIAKLNAPFSTPGWFDQDKGIYSFLMQSLAPKDTFYAELLLKFPIANFSLGRKVLVDAYTDQDWNIKDRDTSDNRDQITLEVVSSISALNKTVSIDSTANPVENELGYTLSFENRSADVVNDLLIIDSLDPNLDLSSIKVVSSSHNYNLALLDHVLWVYFENAFIADSSAKNGENKAHFKYAIRVNVNTNSRTSILNKADFYPDYEYRGSSSATKRFYISPIYASYPTANGFCSNDTIRVNFRANFKSDSTTVFLLEISDELGNFENASIIDSLRTNTGNGEIVGILPTDLVNGSGYRFRISSKFPNSVCFNQQYSKTYALEQTFADKIKISANPSCFGNEVVLQGGNNYAFNQLYVNNTVVQETSGNQFTYAQLKNNDKVFMAQTRADGCRHYTDTLNILIWSKYKPTISNETLFCESGSFLDFIYNLDTSNGFGNLTSLDWSFGDGTTLNQTGPYPSPSHQYSSGIYPVQLISTTEYGCVDTAFKSIEVTLGPLAKALLPQDTFCLDGKAIPLKNKTVIGESKLKTVQWLIESTTLSSFDTSHKFVTSGTKVITQMVEDSNSCADTNQISVFVYDAILVEASVNDSTQCLPVNQFNLTSVTSGSFNEEYWLIDSVRFNKKEIGVNFDKPGSFPYELIARNTFGCISRSKGYLHVLEIDSVNIDIDSIVCNSEQVGLFFFPKYAGTSFKWHVDGLSLGAENVLYKFENTGQRKLLLTSVTRESCQDSSTKIIEVIQGPNASYSIDSACVGSKVLFVNKSDVFARNNAKFTYVFADGTVSEEAEWIDTIRHVYLSPGIYQSELIARTEACSDKSRNSILIYPKPKAAFVVKDGNLENRRVFENTSVNAVQNFWDFGDEKFVPNNQSDFIYNFDSVGLFKVSLVSISDEGCKDTATAFVKIKGDFEFLIPSFYHPQYQSNYVISPSNLINSITFRLYNRLGQHLLTSSDKDNLISEGLATGIYIYRTTIKDIFGDSHEFSGVIYLIRQ